MVQKYIIDKADIHNLITGKEIPLGQGSKARAFCIEIAGEMTNEDVIKALFPQIELGEIYNGKHRFFLKDKEISTFDLKAEVEWLNAPYKKGGEE